MEKNRICLICLIEKNQNMNLKYMPFIHVTFNYDAPPNVVGTYWIYSGRQSRPTTLIRITIFD